MISLKYYSTFLHICIICGFKCFVFFKYVFYFNYFMAFGGSKLPNNFTCFHLFHDRGPPTNCLGGISVLILTSDIRLTGNVMIKSTFRNTRNLFLSFSEEFKCCLAFDFRKGNAVTLHKYPWKFKRTTIATYIIQTRLPQFLPWLPAVLYWFTVTHE